MNFFNIKEKTSDILNYFKKISGNILFFNELVILLILFLFNLLFHSIQLENSSLWYDEIFSIFHSQKDFSAIRDVSKWDVAPPFFNYVLSVWIKLFGISEFSVRFISVFFISLGACVLYVLCKKVFDTGTAFFATLFYTFSNPLFFYSHEVRAYAFIVFLSLVSSLIYLLLIEKPSILKLILLALVNYWIFYTQYGNIIIIFWQCVLILFFIKKRSFVYFLVSGTLTLLFLIPWYDRLKEFFTNQVSNFWLPVPTYNDLANLFLEMFNNNSVSLIFAAFTLFSLVLLVVKKEKNETPFNYKFTYFVLMGIGTILLSFFVSIFFTPIFLKRYILYAIPAVYIVVAIIISRAPFNFLLKTLIVVVLMCVAVFSIDFKTDKNMDYKYAVPYIKGMKDDKTVIVLQTVDVGALFAYYWDRNIFSNSMNNLAESLNNQDVIMRNDSSFMKQSDFLGFTDIVLVQTFNNIADPGNTLIEYINKRGKLLFTGNQYKGITISKFKLSNPVVDISVPFYKKAIPESRLMNEKVEYSDIIQEFIIPDTLGLLSLNVQFEIKITDFQKAPLLVWQLVDKNKNNLFWDKTELDKSVLMDLYPDENRFNFKQKIEIDIKKYDSQKPLFLKVFMWNSKKNNLEYRNCEIVLK